MTRTEVLASMIGVPFRDKGRERDGWDCWGAVRWGLREAFGIEVPSYLESYLSSQDGEAVSAIIAREAVKWPLCGLEKARPGDVLILRVKGRPWHFGLVSEPPYFIHADKSCGTIRERWDSQLWSGRIVGAHRHVSLADRP